MKSNFFLLLIGLSVIIGFFDGILHYVRSIQQRHTGGSFRELYEDNEPKGGDFDE
ncbi:MAG: hypothetical protein NC299_09785 [Lachnospiraceae bacterium]|nr:hypothetical protein [Ruminococcus sp.]MCM1275644.1 hypothetical protein [Lachnospiraceae bacterium]